MLLERGRRLGTVSDHVLDLDDRRAIDPALTGAKGANLARAAVAGFRTVPGVVLTTAAVEVGCVDPVVADALRGVADGFGDVDLVVRSSSTIEDVGSSSMAGRFTSVLGVRGADALIAAVETVVASADRVRDTDGVRRPIAVVIQRQIAADLGGVMFGVDPVTGDRRHIVVEAVPGGPDQLVGGLVVADHYVLTRRGRVVRATRGTTRLSLAQRRALARMAVRAEAAFGSPQDIEWLIDEAGGLWLLQTRPVTATAAVSDRRTARRSVLLGPGPLAETFPAPLRPLEIDLWLEPVRVGVQRSLRTVGAVSARALGRSPIVTTIGGRVAVDLELIGVVGGTTAFRRRIAPGPMLRRLATAWRVGRLRTAFPELADAVIRTVDHDLSAVARLDRLTDDELSGLLADTVIELATAHTYEMLAGMLMSPSGETAPRSTAAGRALNALVDGRAAGWDDQTIVERAPIVLVLVPPRFADPIRLPSAPPSARHRTGEMSRREALRVRVRWLQELSGRIAGELGRRLVDVGVIASLESVAHLQLGELLDVTRGGPPPAGLAERMADPVGPPLPASFRLGADSEIHPGGGGRSARHADRAGEPAGGGRAEGVVVHDAETVVELVGRGESVVLVVDHLAPGLAPLLDRLAAVVSETGSALSHLAILARESSVATVAGVDGARQRYPVGSRVIVDGYSGEIRVIAESGEVAP